MQPLKTGEDARGMETLKFLKIRNFERFQHYHDRRPPWIKLYRDLWNDPRFFELSESDRYFLISFFIIASQNDNKIPANENWLKREMATRKAIPIATLVASNWLEWYVDRVDSDALATSVHDDSIVLPLTRGQETETEIQREKADPPLAPQSPEKRAHGKFGNVLLTDAERCGLIEKFQDYWTDRVDALSEYLAAKRVKYKSHYAVILMWERKNGAKANGHMDKQQRNAETARRLLSRVAAQNSGGGDGGTSGGNTSGLS